MPLSKPPGHSPGPKGNAGPLKFRAQTCLIDRFERPRPGRPVNLDRQSNDAFRQVAMFEHCREEAADLQGWRLQA
jgi:hypothetical protein